MPLSASASFLALFFAARNLAAAALFSFDFDTRLWDAGQLLVCVTPEGCAATSKVSCQRNITEQARVSASPKKNRCDKQLSSWRHISCHTDKNRYDT